MKTITAFYRLIPMTLLFFSAACAQPKDADVKLRVSKYSSQIKVVVTSHASHVLKLPTGETILFSEFSMPFSDCYFELRTRDNAGKDSVVEAVNHSDPVAPPADAPPLMELAKDKSAEYPFDLAGYYQFTPGTSYEIRACFRLSKNNAVPDVYSDWTNLSF